MTFKMTLEWQRVNAGHINRLAKLGDALALRLVEAYRELFADQLNPEKQSEWMKVCDDYCRRDLTTATRRILQDKYGHKIPQQLRRITS
jgi:hypothetical protein